MSVSHWHETNQCADSREGGALPFGCVQARDTEADKQVPTLPRRDSTDCWSNNFGTRTRRDVTH